MCAGLTHQRRNMGTVCPFPVDHVSNVSQGFSSSSHPAPDPQQKRLLLGRTMVKPKPFPERRRLCLYVRNTNHRLLESQDTVFNHRSHQPPTGTKHMPSQHQLTSDLQSGTHNYQSTNLTNTGVYLRGARGGARGKGMRMMRRRFDSLSSGKPNQQPTRSSRTKTIQKNKRGKQ